MRANTGDLQRVAAEVGRGRGIGEVHRPVPRPRHRPRLRRQRRRPGAGRLHRQPRTTSTGSSPTSRPRSRRTPSSDILGIVAVPVDANELTAKRRHAVVAVGATRPSPEPTGSGCGRWSPIPTLLHVMLVWVPALADGGALVHRVGQPRAAHRHPRRRLPELLVHLHGLRRGPVPCAVQQLRARDLADDLLDGRDAVRIPARQERARQPLLPERLLLPGRAVAGRRRVHLEVDDVLARSRPAQLRSGRAGGSTSSATARSCSSSTSRGSTRRSGCRATSRPC